MTTASPTPTDVLEKVDILGPPGTPVTTPEVAEGFDCTQRTVYNRLESLVEDGILQTKKVGANSRVWWRPAETETPQDGTTWDRERIRSHPVFESEMVGVIVWGRDATSDDPADLFIEDANDAFLEMAGFEYEAALDTSWRDLTPEEFYEVSEHHIEEVDATGSGVSYEKQYYHADGSQWWGLFESQKLDDSTYVEFVVEITERKEMEEALRRSEARLQTATNAAEIGVWELDLETGEGLYVSDRYAEILGYDEIPADWDLESALEHYHPEDRERLRDYLENGLGERSFKSRIVRTDGKQRWILVETELYTGKDGEPERAVGTIQDITERERRELNTELLVEISNDLSRLSTPDDIIDTVGTRLGEFLQVSTCIFADVDEANNEATIHHGWNTADVPSLKQTFQLEEYFGDEFARAGRADETVVVRDTALDERANTEEYARLNIGAFVTVPFQWEGRWVANITVTSKEPRDWRRDEIELLEDIAARVFPRIERARAEQALNRTNQSLERLNLATRELLDTESETIADRVAGLVREVLDVEYVALWRYDEQRGDLKETVIDTASDVDLGRVSLSTEISDPVWQAFVGSDVDVATDPEGDEDTWGALESRALVPLGRHGVVCLGSTRVDTFDKRTVDLVETVAATVETAWDRAESKEELERRNEELTRLDQLNTLIREIDQALVAADTREDITEAVCERLADSDLYEFAWVGEFDADDAIRPRSWAGVDSATVEDLATVRDDADTDQDPFVTALRTRELQVVRDIATDPQAGPWREVALERGARSCLAIPLVYDDSVYGLLVVYGGTPSRNHRDTDVLAELGGTIAHAINALETRATFQADSVVELTLRSTAANEPLCRLSEEIDGELVFDGLVPRDDGGATVFFTAEGVTVEELSTAIEDVLGIGDLECLGDCEAGTMFKALVKEPTLAGHVLDQDATIRSLRHDAGTATMLIDLPGTADVREFVEGLGRAVPDLELLSRQTRQREPGQTLQAAVLDRLTPRQQEVLQLAYRSGYFESPRVQTGEDLAEALGIVPSTFTRHIRDAQRTVLDVVFANGE